MILPLLTIRGSEIRQGVVAPLLRHQVIDHVGVEVEGRRRQSLHHDVREVIREQHQVAARVVQKVGVVLALIFPNLQSVKFLVHHIDHCGKAFKCTSFIRLCLYLSHEISLEPELILDAESHHRLVVLLGRIANLLKFEGTLTQDTRENVP